MLSHRAASSQRSGQSRPVGASPTRLEKFAFAPRLLPPGASTLHAGNTDSSAGRFNPTAPGVHAIHAGG
ncbi:hypothetical protein AKJ09_05310 [Labilithrix luteola]|uniref:Uncharacterized protein n=1 Tax=Labilithrix luteola TaxID=1391654 RepID=A0A0K1PZ17_9BACT|nr:hypothetical protein AKJ09_05310 [Labilithrix luteola]